jgi:hypothetical protein
MLSIFNKPTNRKSTKNKSHPLFFKRNRKTATVKFWKFTCKSRRLTFKDMDALIPCLCHLVFLAQRAREISPSLPVYQCLLRSAQNRNHTNPIYGIVFDKKPPAAT